MTKLWLAALLGIATATAAHADHPPHDEDFTFRRIGVPQGGDGRRITVQIDPAEQAARIAPPAQLPQRREPVALPADPASPGNFGWFWARVSPALEAASPARLDSALGILDIAPREALPAPRLQSLQKLAEAHGADILRATVGTRVSPALVLAVIAIESAGRPDAVSPKGAAGLMQLMPATASRFGVNDRNDPAQNIRGGVAYLDFLMNEFIGDPMLVLAGYNAGEGAVRQHGGVPPYAETRDYVPKVLAAWQVARGLCLTPPELLSDGCVFAVRRAGL